MDHVVFPDLLWAGTEHSLEIARQAYTQILAGSFDNSGEEEDVPYNFDIQGNVGVISIRGSLSNKDASYLRFYGMTTYADIRRAMIYAANHADVKAILLDIDSGGGAVSGVQDTANLISTIDKQVKPVYAFSEGTMASAAYWLGSSAREAYGVSTSINGSIGVITTHMEYSKAFKEAGVGVTVVRAGQYKALVNSAEPLTEPALKQLQAQLDGIYGIFIKWTADHRGKTVEQADASFGQGREFLGAAGVSAGLIDGIESFDSLMSKIQQKTLDSAAVTQNNFVNLGNHSMGKKALTEQQIAALAAGGNIQAGLTEDVADEADAENAGGDNVADTDTVEDTPTEADTTASTTPADTINAEVAFLRSELKANQDKVVELQVALNTAGTKVSAMEVTLVPLLAIAADSVRNMRIALGLATVDMSAMSAETLLAEHAATNSSFKANFKVGGVAAATADTESTTTAATSLDALTKARLDAVRPATK